MLLKLWFCRLISKQPNELTQRVVMATGETNTLNKSEMGNVTIVTAGGVTATVITADVVGFNGVVHIVDSVLVPSSIGATVITIDAAMYSTLLSLITLADLEATLTSDGPFTLFAPNNAAFAKLPTKTVALLQTEDGKPMLTDILTYHVIAFSVDFDFTSCVTQGCEDLSVATVQGGMVTFAVGAITDDGLVEFGVRVNDAIVVDPDVLAFNGVTHGIDTVLILMAPSSGGLALYTSLSALFALVLTVAL
jgi:uncharacterized surface protein with fasciclin (FAS1) repeats